MLVSVSFVVSFNIKEQFVIELASVTLYIKVTLPEVLPLLFKGDTKVTTGTAVSTMKYIVLFSPVFPELSFP